MHAGLAGSTETTPSERLIARSSHGLALKDPTTGVSPHGLDIMVYVCYAKRTCDIYQVSHKIVRNYVKRMYPKAPLHRRGPLDHRALLVDSVPTEFGFSFTNEKRT